MTSADPATPALHLTFDDGPDPVGTPQVLAVLAEERVQATFFVLGPALRAHGDLARRILAEGHRIELHGEDHLDHRTAAVPALEADTAAAIGALAAIDVTPRWWRLPWGRPGLGTVGVADAHGLRIVGWDADTHDWRGDAVADQPTETEAAARRGGVVLLHDGLGPGSTRDGFANTAELTAHLIGVARAAGTAVRPLPEPDDPAASDLPIHPGQPLSDLHSAANATADAAEVLR